MSIRPSKSGQQKSFIEKIALNYFLRLFHRKKQTLSPFHLLNELESRKLTKIQNQSLLYAALMGALGVITLYLPLYFFPTLFPSIPMNMGSWGVWNFPWVFILYGAVLAVAEVLGLMVLALYTTHRISDICGFPDWEDKNSPKYIVELFEVAYGKRNKRILDFGIDPMYGLTRFQIITFTTFNLLKATLSNVIIKFLATRVLARVALVRYVDLIGIPVFAAWDAYGTHRVIHEAKVRIMAPNIIEQMTQRLYHQFKDDIDFKDTLFATLHFIAIAKRDFHHNHYWLADCILTKFRLSSEQKTVLSESQLVDKIKLLDFEERQGLAKLFLLGMIIDGKLSSRERRIIDKLSTLGLLHLDLHQLKQWETSFISGKGLQDLFEANL
jgi:hypothetical protein